jgi:hypothetical protein
MDNYETELTLKEYYDILSAMCDKLEENPDDDIAIAAFTDAAYNLGKAKCGHLFPDDLLEFNAAKTPDEGVIVTSVKEED